MKRLVQHRRLLPLVGTSLLLWLGCATLESSAQLLRLGPFDINSRAKLEAVYSSNVEQERKSEATAEREDYYLIYGMDFFSDAPISPSTTLRLDTGFAIEKHFVRDDLDNSSSPFGRLSLSSATELRRLTISGAARWEKKSESTEDVVIPGARSSKTRNPSETVEYGVRADWDNDVFYWGVGYRSNRERYEKEEFKDGDKDETEYTWLAGLRFTDNLSLKYDGSRKYTTQVGMPGAEEEIDTKQNISLPWTFTVAGHIQFLVAPGYKKEDSRDEQGKWSYKHDFGVRDGFDINQRLKLSYGATYSIEEQPEDDDVKFQYDAGLSHELTSTIKQVLTATREPRQTFGSTQDTDSQKYSYTLTKMIFNSRP
ncbi:MAG: hypothetical protein M5U15_00690 [Kiritimatiellae bacterium]|nr:hypothetical protein [Kiritimatiellia bacterium]